MGLMSLSSEHFLDSTDEIKRPSKVKHEERTQRNAELDEFSIKQLHPLNRRIAISLTDGHRIHRHPGIGATVREALQH